MTRCTGFKASLCLECKRHTKKGKRISKLKKWPSGRKTCLQFIQRG